MATSSEVSAGDVIQNTDHNQVRTDVRATHDHEGTEGQQLNAANVFDAGAVLVARGGNARASATAYAVICGGVTSTGAHQSISGVGTSGQILTSNGAAALPTMQNAVSVTQAAQAAIEAETNENTYIPPDLLKHNPGVVKVWSKMQNDGTIEKSHNVTSTGKNSTGNYTVTIATDLSATGHPTLVTAEGDADRTASSEAQAVGTNDIFTRIAGTLTDLNNSLLIMGDL